MLKEFNYKGASATNHFFRDQLSDDVRYVAAPTTGTITFNEYLTKVESDHTQIEQIMGYISSARKAPANINYNVLIGMHLMLLVFLNKYGHDYQRTAATKIQGLIKKKYNMMKHKRGFTQYLIRCKIHRDFRFILRMLWSHESKNRPRARDTYLELDAI